MSLIRHRCRQSGYGLVVIAGLFTAFAVVAAAIIEKNNATADIVMQGKAREQLQKLNVAMLRYARFNNNRLPCPASEQVLATNASFGAPLNEPCYTGQTVTTAQTPFITGTSTSQKLIRGMVPVRALIPYGVSLNDAFDPWGNRIVYIVHRDLTTNAPGTTINTGDLPSISEYNTGQSVSPRPDAVLISFGKDRMDARTRSQSSVASPGLACAAGTDRRRENCDNDVDFIIGPHLVSSTIGSAVYFDDTVSPLRISTNGL